MRELKLQSALALGLTIQVGNSVMMLDPLLNPARRGYAIGGAGSEIRPIELLNRTIRDVGVNFKLAFYSFHMEAIRMSLAEDDLEYGVGAFLDQDNDVILFDVVDIVDDIDVALDVAKTREQLHIFDLEANEVIVLSNE